MVRRLKWILFYPQVDLHPSYPQQLCLDCLQELHRSFKFKHLCEKSEQCLAEISSLDNENSTQESHEKLCFTQHEMASKNEQVELNFDCKAEDVRKSFLCKICGKEFSKKDYLSKHLKRHSKPKRVQKFTCHICGKLVVELKAHMKMMHPVSKPFQCPECAQSFPLKYVLAKHVKFHHRGEKRQQIARLCTLCGKTVHSNTALDYHMRLHNAEQPFECQVCQKRFYSSGHLVEHSRTHTGEKPYKCDTCEKRFATSNILKRHIRIHTGERPYTCHVCGKAFRQCGVLNTHMNKVHKTVL